MGFMFRTVADHFHRNFTLFQTIQEQTKR